MSGYDQWLEAPYQEQAAQDEHFARFCDQEGVDPDDPRANDLFDEWMQAEEEAYMESLAEARAEAAAEYEHDVDPPWM